jgi:hypothetical protein
MSDGVNASGEITITLDAEYVLRPSYAAISAIEEAIGESIIVLANRAANGALKLKDSAIIATEMLKAWGREAGEGSTADQRAAASFGSEGVAKLIYQQGLPGINARLAIVLIAAATGGYTAAGKAKAAAATAATQTPAAA